ncbi:MAG: IS200/IS605 family transposase [Planctomycetes bacterium]|nr:IS200/IS605 family transposase [Planctomycetota bacterium]
MPHTYTSCLIHYVFSTKGRCKSIPSDLRARLYPYFGGIAREHGMKAIAVGGTDDHLHVLMSLPATMSVSKAAQLIKGGSSKWVHDTFAAQAAFTWQEGYGAFSIGVTGIPETVRYIERQVEHHRTHSFEDEYREFLNRHGIQYDEAHVWG